MSFVFDLDGKKNFLCEETPMNTIKELRPNNVSRLKNDAKSVPLPYSLLVTLINRMFFVSPFLVIVRILLMGTFIFLARLGPEILCLLNAFSNLLF